LEKAMLVYSGDDELISSLDILERIKTQPEEEKFMTGIEALDAILKGFRKNQLVVLAAPTKSGKSQMTVELSIRMPQMHPVFIPFEESAEELVRKFHDRGEEPPLFYTPKNITGNTVSWIEKKVVEGIVKYNAKLFFIDHLHFIVPFSGDRLDTRIGQTMRDLKRIAKEHEVVIVIVAHLKKTNVTVAPTLEDLRDSSFIAQEADTVLMMWRHSKRNAEGIMETTNQTVLSVQANRRTGSTGNVKLIFRDGRYFEEDWSHDDVVIDGKTYRL
jgi:replicative DNA helicase